MEKKSRKLPKQARSRKRYDHILKTAADMFAHQGIGQVTTNHIAAEADVSIGSLYQFFPNKEAIIEALTERYMEDMVNIFPQQLNTTQPIVDVIRGVISNIVYFRKENEGFESVLLSLESSAGSKAPHSIHTLIIGKISWVLAAYYPEIEDDRRNLCAAVSFSIVGGIMPTNLPDELMIDEIVLAVNEYQKAFMQRELSRASD